MILCAMNILVISNKFSELHRRMLFHRMVSQVLKRNRHCKVFTISKLDLKDYNGNLQEPSSLKKASKAYRRYNNSCIILENTL